MSRVFVFKMRASLACMLLTARIEAYAPKRSHGAGLLHQRSFHERHTIAVCRSGVVQLRGDTGGPLAQARAFVDKRYFIAGAVVAVALAAAAPMIGCTGGPLRPELTVNWGATCGIFLISGLTLPTSELAAAAFRVREHAAIQFFNLAVLPAVMWLITRLLDGLISPSLRDGLLAMAALPTTINMCVALTRSAGGNEALAIFNAVIGNVLGVVATPLMVLLLLGASSQISLVDAMAKLSKKVILPLVIGQMLRPLVAKTIQGRKQALSRTSETLLLAILYTTFCDTFLRGFGLPASSVGLLAVLLGSMHLVCLATAWQLARTIGLQARDCVAFAMCSTHKTLALGLPLFKIIFQGRADLAVLLTPLILQHPLQLILGSMLAPRLKAIVELEEQ